MLYISNEAGGAAKLDEVEQDLLDAKAKLQCCTPVPLDALLEMENGDGELRASSLDVLFLAWGASNAARVLVRDHEM